jgi:hypothetical protein
MMTVTDYTAAQGVGAVDPDLMAQKKKKRGRNSHK